MQKILSVGPSEKRSPRGRGRRTRLVEPLRLREEKCERGAWPSSGPGDVADLTDRLRFLMADQTVRASSGLAAKRRIRE
jgi:hypothetical protein